MIYTLILKWLYFKYTSEVPGLLGDYGFSWLNISTILKIKGANKNSIKGETNLHLNRKRKLHFTKIKPAPFESKAKM